jgi:predicted nuclease of predicted toxin-antitoxin system
MADFYLDHNAPLDVARLLQSLSHYATTPRDAGLERSTDDEQLLFAADQG